MCECASSSSPAAAGGAPRCYRCYPSKEVDCMGGGVGVWCSSACSKKVIRRTFYSCF